MQVILTEDVPKLGDMGEVVDVAPGYGRNYLIPQGLAVPASGGSAAQIQHKLDQIEVRRERERAAAQEVLGQIDGVAITIPKRVADEDALYGSVSPREIADVLAQAGHEVERKQVVLEQPIGELGIYKVPIKLASGIYAYVKVWVVAM
jgi:large subunit ribosomal protein L9